MTIEQAITRISELPPQEQILVAQAIWDGLAAEAVVPAISAENQKELDRRWERYMADKSSAITVEQLKERVKRRREQS